MRILTALLIVACATSACTPRRYGAKGAAANSPPALASAAPPPQAAEPAKAKPSMESAREGFMQGCMGKAHLPDYCECAFDQFREVFKDVDLAKPLPEGDPHIKTLQEKTVALCASKLNEEQVKANFVEACEEGNHKKTRYCTCAFSALRRNLSLADFMGDADTPRFVEAKKAMVVACKGKYPAEIAKSEFMTGCTKDHPEHQKLCECLWKKVRAKVTPEELAAGSVDVKTVPGLSDCEQQQ